jgi:Xaa-Pro aminopeptidase
MFSQIDEEMRRRHVQALMILGETTLADPNLTYVVGGSLARGGVYFKRVGHKPLLVTSILDLRTARKWGKVRQVETYSQWGVEKLAKRYGREEAYPRLLCEICRRNGVNGKVVLYGRNDLALGTYIIDKLRRFGVRVSTDKSPSILESARETKDAQEIEKLRDVARRNGHVIDVTTKALRSLKRKRGHLALKGKRATIGAIKKMISSELAAEGLGTPEGVIFAIGASSADPHNAGNPSDEVREGKLIVFDIFPQAESGYWSDITRSYLIGKANKKDKQLYDAVYEAQEVSLDSIRAGVSGEDVMSKACDVIESRGYRTVRDVFLGKARGISAGFIHSLGHGVGLTIGERPNLNFLSKQPLKSGQIVTVEPGVYLPGYGGVRIEDTVLITKTGVDVLARVDKELEIT